MAVSLAASHYALAISALGYDKLDPTGPIQASVLKPTDEETKTDRG